MLLKYKVEAILFASEQPLTTNQLRNVFPELERPDTLDLQEAIDSIIEDYQERSIELRELASGYRFQVREQLSPWVSRLFEEKPPKYSRAFLEILAIIAYRQPVTRGEIEEIRGVAVSSNIIRTLMEREWIRVLSYKDVPGRPAVLGTTKQFLDYFNLKSLEELPSIEDIRLFDEEIEKKILAEELPTEDVSMDVQENTNDLANGLNI
ncbi:MAG TPA: SMC-Scp complex subunit ScpB [Methylococcaceae bacterium]|jgi:segregation and condensation protein B|nr:SMC-Scp complex subunit ScpB [Methylococcaceae bacterium]HIN67952.1 SMC-Scp complex subunit ScpB [Methylococcales bacterium]HIA44986.1 SMC-Scp complex subunit ScpB [Methylococcaceae bacterium]HIB61777.1 SMC-Scp complex subunit ScpB [Methylococcaceae bacterium]HIO12480.1 SMC-Scp complex subunit ScpB [Methylococcales bacterium]